MISRKEYLKKVKVFYGKDSMWTKFVEWMMKPKKVPQEMKVKKEQKVEKTNRGTPKETEVDTKK